MRYLLEAVEKQRKEKGGCVEHIAIRGSPFEHTAETCRCGLDKHDPRRPLVLPADIRSLLCDDEASAIGAFSHLRSFELTLLVLPSEFRPDVLVDVSRFLKAA